MWLTYKFSESRNVHTNVEHTPRHNQEMMALKFKMLVSTACMLFDAFCIPASVTSSVVNVSSCHVDTLQLFSIPKRLF